MDQTKRHTLSKSERLSSERRIDALFNGGRRGSVGPLRFCWAAAGVADAGTDASVGTAAGEPGEAADASVTGEAAVSVLFSVPKKVFKRAWKRNLIKRRMKESYRHHKHDLVAAAEASGRHIDIALICLPDRAKTAGSGTKPAGQTIPNASGSPNAKTTASKNTGRGAKSAASAVEIPDFETIDSAVKKSLGKILEKISAKTSTHGQPTA
ncbi:MAG: ribonuclease P protein component [Alistipes sp.]|jgi:ribonuclease P protein component|nr:ribonuclease P protein component [Alistipes sp.]